MPHLVLRPLVQIVCFIDNKWLKSCKWRSCDSVWKVSEGNGTCREKTHYSVCCPSVCLSYRIPCFSCLTSEKTEMSLTCLRKKSQELCCWPRTTLVFFHYIICNPYWMTPVKLPSHFNSPYSNNMLHFMLKYTKIIC